jgi:N-methylhydantoinase B
MSVDRGTGRLDAVDLELYRNRFVSVTEEMGSVLEHTGFSPNINSRRDFSCALFDSDGAMVTHAAHIPVHLGSTPLSVRAAMAAIEMKPGDVVILNDPYCGGTHLPDVTLVAPVHRPGARAPLAYVANRAHHADIGGSSAGSMPLARQIYEEGFRIPPVHLVRSGRVVKETRTLFLANTRVAAERLGDLDAQLASLARGKDRVLELVSRFGEPTLLRAMKELQGYSARMVSDFVTTIPTGRWRAIDHLDDDGFGSGPVAIRVTISRRGAILHVDFAGTDAQVSGPLNANFAVTTAAVFYVVAALVGQEIPANEGMMKPVRITAPEGSVVHCRHPAAVAGGNVETSQRIVDVLLRALAPALPSRIPAASCGTMTNLAVGGYDARRRREFSYYETVGGGCGAGPDRDGTSAIQTHMTNTLNTPVEVLEEYYPLEVCHYRVRRGSGGAGRHRGGDGIDREIRVLADTDVTLLAERRKLGPYGLAGGHSGRRGRDTLSIAGRTRTVAGKFTGRLSAGDRIRVETPGGGGWGRPKQKDQPKRRRRRA